MNLVSKNRDRAGSDLVGTGLLVVAVAAPLLVLVEAPVALRAPIVAAFLLFGLGLACVRRLNLDGAPSVFLALGLSTAALATLATAAVALSIYSALLVTACLAAITLVIESSTWWARLLPGKESHA